MTSPAAAARVEELTRLIASHAQSKQLDAALRMSSYQARCCVSFGSIAARPLYLGILLRRGTLNCGVGRKH